MKKPYLKKFCKTGAITSWIVDGDYIRTNIDEEFTNFGHHYRFNFIPENEVWIDHESVNGEEKYYLCNMLETIKAIKKGRRYKQAVDMAERAEKRERAKSEIAKTAHKKLGKGQSIAEDIYKRKMVCNNSHLKVWIVNGELVRDQFFIDFTEGGHDKVYHFIPEGEIWIDDDISPKERKFVLLHEVHERNLMAKGWTYLKAHSDSSYIEFFCRHHPKKIDRMLDLEFKKSKVN
ncbi:MAG: hypothetical protein ABIB79_00605 [archaeon]